MEILFVSGDYILFDKDYEVLGFFNDGDTVVVKKELNFLTVFKGDIQVAKANFVKFASNFPDAVISLKSSKTGKFIEYNDDIELYINNDKKMCVINSLDFEKYVATVVKSEVGNFCKSQTFYEAQAIIVRTYALNNIHKHKDENFGLCDDVHCQAFTGRNTNPSIDLAVRLTGGEVLVDSAGNLLNTTFYSNSGGQTMNSEDYWNGQVSYLRSVDDFYSLSGRNAFWEREYLVKDWLNLLEKYFGYDIHSSKSKNAALNFEQKTRQVYFADTKIKLKDVREKLGLRSTFFSVKHKGNKVVLEGRGYGHGVGLSQEGACEMAQQGCMVEEILQFYYQGCQIVNR